MEEKYYKELIDFFIKQVKIKKDKSK